MSPPEKQTYLITGANEGIGLALLTHYLARPNNTVVAAVREPPSSSTHALEKLSKGHGSSLIVIEIDNSSPTDAKTSIDNLMSHHQILKLDTVIANAAVQDQISTLLAQVDPLQVQEHLSVNVVGTLKVFQAVLPLLQRAPQPKFVVLGSPMGSIGGMEKRPVPMGAYGVSKAAADYLVRKIHFENDGLIAFTIDPGLVQTESGNKGAQAFGMKGAPIIVKESVEFLVMKIEDATIEEVSGQFPSIEGGDCE